MSEQPSVSVSEPVPPVMACECATWARADVLTATAMLDHHPTCPHAGKIDVLADYAHRVRKALDWWGSQEDGLPRELNDLYAETLCLEGFRRVQVVKIAGDAASPSQVGRGEGDKP